MYQTIKNWQIGTNGYERCKQNASTTKKNLQKKNPGLKRLQAAKNRFCRFAKKKIAQNIVEGATMAFTENLPIFYVFEKKWNLLPPWCSHNDIAD